MPSVLLGIPWPALRGPLRNQFWKKRRPQPYWGGDNSGNALEASIALNYRAWGIPAVLSTGIPGKALRAFPVSFRNFSGISSGKSQPYWGCGLTKGQQLKGIIVSEIFTLFSGTKKEPKPKLLSPDIFWWGGGLPRKGVGAKKFGMPLETREIKLFWWDIPGFCSDIPAVPEKFEKKKFVFNFRPLFFTISAPIFHDFSPRTFPFKTKGFSSRRTKEKKR